jgi:hypothetical protein
MRRLFLIVVLCLFGGSLLALAHPEIREYILPKPEADAEGDPNEMPITSSDDPKDLLATDPIAFFEKCLERYDREVKGYSLTMQKQERINGKLQETQIHKIHFREKPFSVYMELVKGSPLAERILYVEGENGGKLLARPRGKLARGIMGDVVERDTNSADAKQSGRYAINEFGLKAALQRIVKAGKAARERKALHVEYLGTFKVKEAGDRLCYKIKRSKFEKPEEDGITEVTIYIDTETWLLVGSVCKGEDNKLIAEYFFRDIQLNPKFAPDQFTRKALIP